MLDHAVQVHGAMAITDRSPLGRMWAMARGGRIYDGPDEVHKMTVARRILKSYEEGEGWCSRSARRLAGRLVARRSPAFGTGNARTRGVRELEVDRLAARLQRPRLTGEAAACGHQRRLGDIFGRSNGKFASSKRSFVPSPISGVSTIPGQRR